MVIDMGSHMLSGQVGSQNLLQLAVPGLEDRARTFSPLHGVLLMPGESRLGTRLLELAVHATEQSNSLQCALVCLAGDLISYSPGHMCYIAQILADSVP